LKGRAWLLEEKDKAAEEEIRSGQTENSADTVHAGAEGMETADNLFPAAVLAAAEKPYSLGREIMDWVICIAVAFAIAFVLRTFVVTLVNVDGQSMVPTLRHGDRLVVVRLFYKPKQFDIIIFHPRNRSKEPYVKRVIGMPGQTVAINNDTGEVSVNGKTLDEPYINNRTRGMTGTNSWTVPENHVFVMGDNRGNSHDSRNTDVGFVSFESILGGAVFRVWPFASFGKL
jgi:signal peptidase I